MNTGLKTTLADSMIGRFYDWRSNMRWGSRDMKDIKTIVLSLPLGAVMTMWEENKRELSMLIETVSLNDSFELFCISVSVNYVTLNK